MVRCARLYCIPKISACQYRREDLDDVVEEYNKGVMRTQIPVVLSHATRIHFPDPAGVVHVFPALASLLAALGRSPMSGGATPARP